MSENDGEEIQRVVIDGVLDLHTFQPREIGGLVKDYLEECLKLGILEVRIIHGKGIGNLKRSVESILGRHPEVERFASASERYGGMGATMAYLKKKN